MKGWVVYGAYFILVASISALVTIYVRTGDTPHPHRHALAQEDTLQDADPVKVTIVRQDGRIEKFEYPSNAKIFPLGDQTWIGWDDGKGNFYDAVLTDQEGDVILMPARLPDVEDRGPAPIPLGSTPPLGPGPAPTPPTGDHKAVEDWYEAYLSESASE